MKVKVQNKVHDYPELDNVRFYAYAGDIVDVDDGKFQFRWVCPLAGHYITEIFIVDNRRLTGITRLAP